MKKIAFFLIINLFATGIIYSQINFRIEKNTKIVGINDSIPQMGNIKLLEQFNYFSGYLIIKFDSNSVYDKIDYKNKFNYLMCDFYWITSLKDIEVDSLKYYHTKFINLILSLAELSDTLPKNPDLINFLKFFYSFQHANNGNLKTYLYNNYLIPNDSLLKTNFSLWKLDNDNVSYMIFQTHFVTAILNFVFNKYSKKIFMPVSYLEKLENISSEEASKNNIFKSKAKLIFEN